MGDKMFQEPTLEVIHFSEQIMTTSVCGCFDEEWCPSDYSDCTSDSAVCTCEVNHVAGTANCTPCSSYE